MAHEKGASSSEEPDPGRFGKLWETMCIPPAPEGTSEPLTAEYDPERIEKVWRELCKTAEAGTLPGPNDFPGFDRQPTPIKRLRKALYDDAIGLGMQLRWSLALATLRRVATATDKDAAKAVCKACDIRWPAIKQLGSMAGENMPAEASSLHLKTLARDNLEHLCARLNEVQQAKYRKVSNRHRITPALFQAPYHGEDAVEEFNHFLLTGEVSRLGRVDCSLLEETKRYFPNKKRNARENELVARLRSPHACRPIQCIVSEGAQTAVEALARHLADILPARLQDGGPRRDIFLIPCGRWLHPSGFRGMEYLVHHLVQMLRGGRSSGGGNPAEMSESQLQQHILWLREELGRRPVILVFVGNDAIAGPLARLQEAIADAPLPNLLAQLSRPALGTGDEPFDPRHFQWSYFLVIGTSAPHNLGEYRQPTLDWPPIDLASFSDVLDERKFRHRDEILVGMYEQGVPATEAEIGLFEQVRRIETIREGDGAGFTPSDFQSLTRISDLHLLAERFVKVLDDPQRGMSRAVVLLTAFAIGGLKRTTLVRCLMLWRGVFPGTVWPDMPATVEEWAALFDAWLDGFAPIVRSGPDERWREIDPHEHPFEYPGSLHINLAGDGKAWWEQSIDFLIADVRNAVVAEVEKETPALAQGIHRILAEEALRQHTMALRHTSRAERLTIRSHRRGLQALLHGLASIPGGFDQHAGDTVVDPALHLDVSLPAQHMQRFKYLYCGLFPSLFRDDTLGNVGAAWGAEALKLEIATYADKLLFARIDSQASAAIRCGRAPATLPFGGAVTAAMLDNHDANLAMAGVRAGGQSRWDDVRGRLSRSGGHPDGIIPLPEKVLMLMDLTARGPDDGATSMRFETMVRKLDLDLRGFDDLAWRLADGPALAFPTAAHLRYLVNSHVAVLRARPGPRKSDASTLLYLYGMMRADTAAARLHDHDRTPAAVRRSLSQLLKCAAALTVARQLMWDGYGEESHPLPYLAAEGLRTSCRVGLEIIRVARRHGGMAEGDDPAELIDLVDSVTSGVRKCLDDYALVFHANDSERTQMLILESRFARLACDSDPAWSVPGGALAVLDQPYQASWPAAFESRRYELALAFLNAAEASLVTFFASYSLRIRLLSERCSTLRYLAMNLARQVHANPALPGREALLERASMTCALALLDVQQMENIIACLGESRAVWLTAAMRARWSATAAHYKDVLRALQARLSGAGVSSC